MTFLQGRGAGWVACAALLLLLAAAPAAGQQPAASYEVRRGDTLFAIARRSRYEGIDVNQMLVAIYRTNQEAFSGGNVGALKVGHVLRIPSREEAAAVSPAEARREVQNFVSRPPVRIAAVPREPPPKPPAKPAVSPPPRTVLSPEEAVRRYREGLALEQRGDDKGALKAFLEAGESGHGLAQRKLGEIYDRGNAATERDFETAIRWYQRAREQGVPLPKPMTRAPR